MQLTSPQVHTSGLKSLHCPWLSTQREVPLGIGTDTRITQNGSTTGNQYSTPLQIKPTVLPVGLIKQAPSLSSQRRGISIRFLIPGQHTGCSSTRNGIRWLQVVSSGWFWALLGRLLLLALSFRSTVSWSRAGFRKLIHKVLTPVFGIRPTAGTSSEVLWKSLQTLTA